MTTKTKEKLPALHAGVDTSLLERDLAIIRERRGPDAIHTGDKTPPVIHLPVGSPSIMRITGGGVPLGRTTRLWGGPSTGKSLLVWMIIAAAQKFISPVFPEGMLCNYCNVEKQYDKQFTERLGVNVKDMLVLETTIIEELAGEIELLLGSCHVHAIDSCSFATSQDELAGDPGDWNRALDARVWKKFLHRINARRDDELNTLIYVDHASKDWNTNAEKALGGKDMEHASDMSIHFVKGQWLFYDDEGLLETDDKIKEKTGRSMTGLKEADGVEVNVRCNKSRVCRPFRTAKMRLDLNSFQFDTLFEFVEGAKFFDEDGLPAHRSAKPAIAEKTTAKSSFYKVPGYEKPVQGAKGLRGVIEADPILQQSIMRAMLAGN